MSEQGKREWELYLPEEDRRIYDLAGYGERKPLGKKPGLLVIDVVVSFTGTKPMPMEEAIKEYKSSCGTAAWESLPKIKEMIESCRAADVPVTYIKGNPSSKYFVGDTTKNTNKKVSLTREEIFKKYDAPIHPMIAPLDSEFVCEKTRASAFFATPLATYLYRKGIDCLLLAGCTTSGCVRSSTIDAWNAGFPVFIVEECVFDRSRHSHLTSLYELDRKYATVLTVDEAKKQIQK